MSWLILFSHAFNPLLVSIALKQQDENKSSKEPDGLERIFSAVFTSFIFYLFWLAAHFLVMKITGSNFDFDEFIGVGKGIAYFLPFVLGVVILMIDLVVRPRLRLEKSQQLVSSLSIIILFFGTYFMLINYLAWFAV